MSKDEAGDNRTALVAKTKEIFREIMAHEDERAETNAAIAELYARLKRMGFSVKAARAALARYKLENDARELWDETFDLTSDALGVSIQFQPDFFDDEDLFNPNAADEQEEEPDNEDGDGEETHLSDEEREAAGRNEGVDVKDGPGTEQSDGDAILKAGLSQTLGTTH